MGLGSALASAFGSISGDIINTNSAAAKAKRAATIQNNRNVYNYQHQIQWAVDDAKKAGINPAVALNTGGNVNTASQPQTFKANMPDLSAAMSASKANDIAQQNANTNEIVGTANAIKTLKEAGVVDRNTATKEVEAQAQIWNAQTQAQYVDSQINRLNKMLPGELQGQAQELAVKAYQNRLNEREIKTLEKTGLTLSEWKGIGNAAIDLVKFAIGGKMARPNSAERNTQIDYYDKNGEITGGKYIHYR